MKSLAMGGLLGLALALSAACDTIPPASAMGDGPPTAAPPGWIGYCLRHQEDRGCPPLS